MKMDKEEIVLTPREMERRRRVLASFNQVRAATYAFYADQYRTRYLKGFTGWVWGRKWVREQISDFQIMAQAHAQTARMLMGFE